MGESGGGSAEGEGQIKASTMRLFEDLDFNSYSIFYLWDIGR